MISTFTYAVFFMAVPHRGSNYAGFGKIASNIVGLVTFQQKNSFLQSVSIDSDYNKELNSKFEPLLKLYKFYTWMEGREVPDVGLVSILSFYLWLKLIACPLPNRSFQKTQHV